MTSVRPRNSDDSGTTQEADELPRVLVVDDDERNLMAIATVLEDLSEVILARSGEEALRHLLKGEFAVILLDVYMPGMDGYETAQIIRERDQTKRIPIVFLSAVNKETEHLMRGYAMGAVDYVFKPVDPLVLRSKVAVFVDLFAKSREIERTARKEQALLDANLRANNDRLRVERELRRAESQLFQAQKMDAIGKLTGGVAHDFNNLLAAVIGGLSLLERRVSLDEKQQKILSMTRHAAEQGTELVGRLLAFARRQQLQPEVIDLASLREAVADLLTHTLGGLINIEWRLEDGVWNAFADQAQLELALVNLIINARDAMPAGGTVTISATNERSTGQDSGGLGGDCVRLSITDTGTGISSENLEKVMEPFFTTKELGKGSGLGLSMVYGFAKQSNGAFHLRSEVGQGTTAELLLPRAPEGRAAQERPRAEAGRRQATRKLDILLVDDHAEVRSTTAAVLGDMGHKVVEAANGAEALKALSDDKCRCDLLITDYAMPHLSGTDFLREARQLCPEVPALIITGYAEADAISDCPAGVEILLKPFTPNALDAAISRICEAGTVAS